VLRDLPQVSHPDLVVGTLTGDDAAVWQRPDGSRLVATVDFFTPIVDDATTWGRIAATNAVSDVYAMGADPLFALNIVAWPKDVLPLELLGDALQGAQSVAAAAGYVVVGGHTVDGAEPMFGQVVIGVLAVGAPMLTNDAGRADDDLVLTKSLGTGVVATAVKRLGRVAVAPGGRIEEAYAAAVTHMTSLNAQATRVALASGVAAATDVTGFGLVGHLHKLALASGVVAHVQVDALPVIAGVRELIADGFVPGGTVRNAEFVGEFVSGDRWADPSTRALLADPQTSGGMLLCAPSGSGEGLVHALAETGVRAVVIGHLGAASQADPAGTIVIR
jgi:selenide, water dikinase